MGATEQVLAERGSRYGKFTDHADITQVLKEFFRSGDEILLDEHINEKIRSRWDLMANDQKECLEMVAHKLGRIFNGDPDYGDSWRDIGGYCTLVANRLEGVPEST